MPSDDEKPLTRAQRRYLRAFDAYLAAIRSGDTRRQREAKELMQLQLDGMGVPRKPRPRRRTLNPKPAPAILDDRDWLERRYVDEERGTREIAELLGCNFMHVWRALDRHNIDRRPPGHPPSGRLFDPGDS